MNIVGTVSFVGAGRRNSMEGWLSVMQGDEALERK
jgi:hypothetical protein